MPERVLTGNDEDDLQPATRRQVAVLTLAVQELARSNTLRRTAFVAMCAGFAALLVLSVSNVLLFRQVSAQADCLRNYANQNAARNARISPLTFEQLGAIDRAFQSIKPGEGADPQEFTKARADEIAAAKAYRDAFGDTPLPDPPSLNC